MLVGEDAGKDIDAQPPSGEQAFGLSVGLTARDLGLRPAQGAWAGQCGRQAVERRCCCGCQAASGLPARTWLLGSVSEQTQVCGLLSSSGPARFGLRSCWPHGAAFSSVCFITASVLSVPLVWVVSRQMAVALSFPVCVF